MRRPEVKQGTNRGRRVYWVDCPKCGPGREHHTKVSAQKEKREHECNG